jgi:single-strand DNA-binding protein
MASVNHCLFIGKLGKDPELFETTSGHKVASFSLALSEKWKDKGSNQWKTKTEWIQCKAWGNLADLTMKYLAKGSEVYLETKVNTRAWSDEKSVKHFATEFSVVSMQFIGKKKDASGDEGNTPLTGDDGENIPF